MVKAEDLGGVKEVYETSEVYGRWLRELVKLCMVMGESNPQRRDSTRFLYPEVVPVQSRTHGMHQHVSEVMTRGWQADTDTTVAGMSRAIWTAENRRWIRSFDHDVVGVHSVMSNGGASYSGPGATCGTPGRHASGSVCLTLHRSPASPRHRIKCHPSCQASGLMNRHHVFAYSKVTRLLRSNAERKGTRYGPSYPSVTE